MAAVITSIKREGQFALLQLALPGQPVHNAGVLLLDPAGGRLHFRLRAHWDDLADPDDAAYLAALDEDFRDKIEQMGGQYFLESLEDSLSNILLLTDREAIPVDSFSRVADQLFARHVEAIPVACFRTHLPLYPLEVAAGLFGPDKVAAEPEDWLRAPAGMRLHEGMFIAPVKGHSMEPRVPDKSLNIFRAPVVGSRQGKIVLVELREVDERFTVKRYTSKKVFTGEDQWEHESIRLEPLNREFVPIDLRPDQVKYVIAEWIQTLE